MNAMYPLHLSRKALLCMVTVALVAILALPGYVIFYLHPFCKSAVIDRVESEAMRTANHLSRCLKTDWEHVLSETDSKTMAAEFGEFEADFGLVRFKLFNRHGRIVYSTNEEEVGRKSKKSYFRDVVAQGVTLSKLIKRESVSMEGEKYGRDVVEIYVPVMRDGSFQGAFELYYDVASELEASNSIARHGILSLVPLVGLLLLGMTIALASSVRSMRKLEAAEEKILNYQRGLERTVKERTQSLNDKIRALDSSRRELLQIFNTSGDAMLVLDVDQRIVKANRSLLSLRNTCRSNVIGRKCYDVFECSGCAQRDCVVFREIISGSAEGYEADVVKLRPDGSRGTYIMTAAPIYGESGNIEGILQNLKDITIRQHAEEQLRRVERSRTVSELAGGISHDMNNTLGAAALAVDHSLKLLHKVPAPAKIARMLTIAQKTIDSSVNLSKRLLSLSHDHPLAMEQADLNSLIKETLDFFTTRQTSGIRIKKRLPGAGPDVVVDAELFRQALLNLLINSAHAIEDNQNRNGRATISVSLCKATAGHLAESVLPLASTDCWNLTIRDSGCGISEADISRIFEPFYTTRTEKNGSGLGMAMVLNMVKQHQGGLYIKSTLGQGTAVTLLMPATCITPRIAERQLVWGRPETTVKHQPGRAILGSHS